MFSLKQCDVQLGGCYLQLGECDVQLGRPPRGDVLTGIVIRDDLVSDLW
jgi:hypothetical protein